MRPALQRRSETYESSVITAGVRIATDTVLVLGNASYDTLKPRTDARRDRRRRRGPSAQCPPGSTKGTAVYGQDDPGGFEGAVEQAIDRGNVFSVR